MQNQATNNVIFIKKWETNLSFSSKFTILIVMTPKPYNSINKGNSELLELDRYMKLFKKRYLFNNFSNISVTQIVTDDWNIHKICTF